MAAAQPEYLGKMEREAVHRLRELFSQGREASLFLEGKEEEDFVSELSELALYPEKPLLSFTKRQKEEVVENTWNSGKEDTEFFRLAKRLRYSPNVHKLIICGGVDDGKSTLIGRILYDTKSREEQEAICRNPEYLRKDKSVDYALLAGKTEDEERQGITVQVSYSVFDWGKDSFLMADVPGHEEYTHNMAFAASGADTAIIMIAANKGIVPQTRRHTRICHFMGIGNLIFAVNKMDMVSFDEAVFGQVSEEIAHMMEEYPECIYRIVPVAAKSGINIITENAEEMAWYQGGTLLDALRQTKEQKTDAAEADFCMPVQRTCKSSQMKGAEIKKRVIQGEVISGSIRLGDEIMVYPTARRAKISGLYCLDRQTDTAAKGDPVGIELDRELDVARGYILTKQDSLIFTDRIEADLLWASDNRLTQGKRYKVTIAAAEATAAVTKICYQTDVNTGEHRYAEHITKNALARCELCFPKQIAVSCEKENHTLGTIRLIDRETNALAAYGNIIHTISEEAWIEDGREILSSEREAALGQKAGMILFDADTQAKEYMNYVERYLLRMGFHTIQAVFGEMDACRILYIKNLLDAGLIVLLYIPLSDKEAVADLLSEKGHIFDCTDVAADMKNMGGMLKQMKHWASELI